MCSKGKVPWVNIPSFGKNNNKNSDFVLMKIYLNVNGTKIRPNAKDQHPRQYICTILIQGTWPLTVS